MEFVGVVAGLWGFSKLMGWYWYGARDKDISEIKILSAKCLAVTRSANMTNEEKEKEYMEAMNKLNNLNPTDTKLIELKYQLKDNIIRSLKECKKPQNLLF